MPALTYRDRPLLSVRVTKTHTGIYPFSPAAVAAAEPQLTGCKFGMGTVRPKQGTPVPIEGIETLVRARKAQIEGEDARGRPLRHPDYCSAATSGRCSNSSVLGMVRRCLLTLTRTPERTSATT